MRTPIAILLVVLLIATVVALPKWGFTATSAGYYPSAALLIAFIVVLLLEPCANLTYPGMSTMVSPWANDEPVHEIDEG